MATLARSRLSRDDSETLRNRLESSVPTPFPTHVARQQLLQEELLEELAEERVEFDVNEDSRTCPSRLGELSNKSSCDVLHEIMPSIVYVQKSCLMTLNDLLSSSTKWNPIVPDRRHSMPSTSQLSTAPKQQPISALPTILSNLQNIAAEGENTEIDTSLNDAELIDELRLRVDSVAASLDSNDARLAHALVSLLSHFNRLSIIKSKPLSSRDTVPWHSNDQAIPSADVFDVLKRQLSDLQIERQSKGDIVPPGTPPILAVETSLIWTRIDEELETVLSLCKERNENLPPQYNVADYDYDDVPPEYDYDTFSSIESFDTKARSSLQPAINAATANEKMRLDLEAVTLAIDRLYLVAPQLLNQRVELKTSKLQEMENARHAGTQSRKSALPKGKQREKDVEELENILDLIGKASERKMADQIVILEGGIKSRMERAHQRDMAKRDAFVEQLAKHSDAGRFHAQDAVLHSPKFKDPEATMTLPEFLRESMIESQRSTDSEGLPFLPESDKESIPNSAAKTPPVTRSRKNSRSRSLSAPSRFWLRPSSSKSPGLPATIEPGVSNTSMNRSRSREESATSSVLDVHYVAEHHENLNHVLVFLTVLNVVPGADIKAEVLPSSPNSAEGGHLVISCGLDTSPTLHLPVPTVPGIKDVKVHSGYFELKLATSSVEAQAFEPIPLLDASQLSTLNPTSFTCASCSLPLVQSSKIDMYRDLPSEHWEELVDAWMCHADQTLHEQVTKHGRGFWPQAGQALIGGSYILFEESSVVKTNLYLAEQPKRGEDWRLVRCICGAVIGRCQNHQSEGGLPATVYRLVKYAIRPLSHTTEPSRIPLSAFIVEDMVEFVHAHASYRFVICDEEGERPRLLIWLFKPSMRIAYTTPKQYALPKSGSIHAAKILFKVLGPSTTPKDMKNTLNKYPGFPQAEYLYYPIDICGRIIGLLKESNTSYPESMRTMIGLDIGWLHRA